MKSAAGVVVVVLDHHLGSARDVDGQRAGIDLSPAATTALEGLRAKGVPIILVVDRLEKGDAYGTPGLEFDDVLPLRGEMDALLRDIAKRKKTRRGIFVAADRKLRGVAAAAGWTALPHVAAATRAAAGGKIRIASLSGRSDVRRLGWMLPWEFVRTDTGWHAVAMVDEATLARAALLDVTAAVLDVDPGVEDLVRVHLDGNTDAAEELARHRVVRSERGVAWLALGPGDDVEDIRLHGSHGHLLQLRPSPELLDRPAGGDLRVDRVAAHLPERHLEVTKAIDFDLSWILRRCCLPDAATFQADVDRYRGAAPLDGAGAIVSRHVRHPDNSRVVQALLADLRAIGYCAWTHTFSYGGQTLSNVIADLPGRGRFVIDPGILDRVREILRVHPWPDPRWTARVEELLGKKWRREFRLDGDDERQLRIRLEAAMGLCPWWPWWLRFCRAPGFGAEIVLVGCHLDSTAASDPGYSAQTDPAPGADDDASGIAAVLSAARYMWRFRGELTHTVRFAFFNAEEVGIVGSGAYAGKLKGDGAPLKAVICADMVGFNSDVERIFEIHAGYTDPLVRDSSVPIAELVRNQALAQGRLGQGQIYQGTSWPPAGASDRSLYDGAINRSDHASFQAQGYGAVVVSEDFFINLPGEPGADPNPNYHHAGDTTIDAAYGADIACAISAAARVLAR